MIFTSYYANVKKIQKVAPNIVPISIAGKPPRGYDGLQYKKLAPKYEFFKIWKENHDNDYYIKEYNKQVLSKLDPKKVIEELYELSGGEDIVLLCYEKPGDFCHRHLVADWLSKNGYFINEAEIKYVSLTDKSVKESLPTRNCRTYPNTILSKRSKK